MVKGFTFLTGATGVHAVAAAVAQRAGDATRCRYHAREVAAMELQGEKKTFIVLEYGNVEIVTVW